MATTTTEASITTTWGQIATGVTSLIAQMAGQGKVLIHVGASTPGSNIGVPLDHQGKTEEYFKALLVGDKVFAKSFSGTATLTLINFAP